jgi:hypothetical protein
MSYLERTRQIILTFLGIGTIILIGSTMIVMALILSPFEYIITGDIKILKTTNHFLHYSLDCLYENLWGV